MRHKHPSEQQHPGRRRRRAGTKRSRPTAASPSFLKAREVVLVYRPFPAFAVRISLYGACGLRVCFGSPQRGDKSLFNYGNVVFFKHRITLVQFDA